MRVDKTSYTCDFPNCTAESLATVGFLDALEVAASRGWFVPGVDESHYCPLHVPERRGYYVLFTDDGAWPIGAVGPFASEDDAARYRTTSPFLVRYGSVDKDPRHLPCEEPLLHPGFIVRRLPEAPRLWECILNDD